MLEFSSLLAADNLYVIIYFHCIYFELLLLYNFTLSRTCGFEICNLLYILYVRIYIYIVIFMVPWKVPYKLSRNSSWTRITISVDYSEDLKMSRGTIYIPKWNCKTCFTSTIISVQIKLPNKLNSPKINIQILIFLKHRDQGLVWQRT